MKHIPICVCWGLGVAAVLLSPILVIFLTPLAIGIAVDIFELAGETQVALIACGTLTFVFLRRVPVRQAVARLRPLMRLGRAAKAEYGPKSGSAAPMRRI